MSWQAVVAALEDNNDFRSRVSVYMHPLAGRPILWHVLRALVETTPAPELVRIVHRAGAAPAIPDLAGIPIELEPVPPGSEARSLRAAVTAPGLKVLVDGAVPLLSPATIARLLRAAESGVAAVPGREETDPHVAIAGEGPALASADDPRLPAGVARVTPTSAEELVRVVDRRALAESGIALRDRLVRWHATNGVTFLLPATVWIDADVRIGADTVVYPGVVMEGTTEIGSECVIGPYSRIVEATIGRGAELKGWNYVTRTAIRNHAVIEPYVRRGID